MKSVSNLCKFKDIFTGNLSYNGSKKSYAVPRYDLEYIRFEQVLASAKGQPSEEGAKSEENEAKSAGCCALLKLTLSLIVRAKWKSCVAGAAAEEGARANVIACHVAKWQWRAQNWNVTESKSKQSDSDASNL